METKFDFVKKLILTVEDNDMDVFIGLIEKAKAFLTLTGEERKMIDDILNSLLIK